MTHLVNELWVGLVTSAILVSLKTLCSATKVQGAQKVQQKKHGQLPVWNFHTLSPERCWAYTIFSGPDFLLAFTWLLPSPGARAEADPSGIFWFFFSRNIKSPCINMETGLLPSSSHKLRNGAQEAEILERP